MTLTEDEVIQILKLVEQSSFDELQLEMDGLKLVVRKTGCGTAVAERDTPVPAGLQSKAETRVAEPAPRGAKKPEAATPQEGLVPIKAPLLGTVYRRPAPEAPHYVDVGSFVKEDDTVCLIEVMKVFTAVKAGVRGYVTEVLVETNEMVEYGQSLFMIKPAAEPA